MVKEKSVPVSVGDEIEAAIEGVGTKGDGFFKVEGFVVFVKGATEEGVVKVRVTKVLASYAFAEVIK